MTGEELMKQDFVYGKTTSRVPAYYRKWPSEFKAQFKMLLPDGFTCGDCAHSERCKAIFGGNDSNTSCQFEGSRFQHVSMLTKEEK